MSNPTLASITAELEAVETAARGRGSLTCDHLAGRIANIRGELQQIAQPQPPAETQPVAYADPQAFANFKERGHLGGPHGREWMWAKPDAGLVPVYAHPPPSAPVNMGVRVARLCEEASEVLEAVGVSGVPLPSNWRWPLADELGGIAAIAQQTAAEAQAQGGGEVVAWKDNEGMLWSSMDEVPGQYLPPVRTFAPLYTAPPPSAATPLSREHGSVQEMFNPSAPVGKTFCEQMEMLRDDFARYSDGDPKVPFVVVRESLVAALNEWDALAQQPAAVDGAIPEGWRVMPFTGSWKACDERWEVYSPDGSGGVILASEVRSRYVASLLDALAAQPGGSDNDH